MKNSSKQSRFFKLITTHALVVFVLVQPWVVSFVSDLVAITGGQQDAPLSDRLIAGMYVISNLALAVAVLAFAYYLLHKRNSDKRGD